MNKRAGGMKTAGIVIAAVFLVTGVLLAAFLATVRGSTRDTITLPEPAPPAEPAPAGGDETLFLSVERENIQRTLDMMRRPDAYYQTVTVTAAWEDGSAEKTIELWRSGDQARALIVEGGRTRHLLTDGATTWFWYEGEASAFPTEMDFDSLTGVPLYEPLAALDLAAIQEAAYVELAGREDVGCLYLSVRDGAYEDRYWIDVETQLLYQADSFQDGEHVFQLRQTALELLTAGDALLEEMFRLPDGVAAIEG